MHEMKALAVFLIMLMPFPATAGCEKGYERQERSAIELSYKQEMRRVEEKKDLAIKDALDRYSREYDERSKDMREEAATRMEALRQRRIAEQGKRENYVDEADAIRDGYVDDVAALKKDTSDRSRKEIAEARNIAATSAKHLADQRKLELDRLKAKLADPWCGDNFPPWLRGPGEFLSPERKAPEEVPAGGGGGIRG
jgi:hypothetical protein